MLLINLMVNLLYRKYGVPLHNFFENWTRGISYLKIHTAFTFDAIFYICPQKTTPITMITENKDVVDLKYNWIFIFTFYIYFHTLSKSPFIFPD